MTLSINFAEIEPELRNLIREEFELLQKIEDNQKKPFVWIVDAAPRYGVSVAYLRKLKQEKPELFGAAGRKVLLNVKKFEQFLAR
jgi:hypothetical protein